MSEKYVVEEKIISSQTVLFVAVPRDDLDGRIYPAVCEQMFCDKVTVYSDRSCHIESESWRKIQEICTDPKREWANERIIGFDLSEEGFPAKRKTWENYAISVVHNPTEKLKAKLERMTAREYYQCKW